MGNMVALFLQKVVAVTFMGSILTVLIGFLTAIWGPDDLGIKLASSGLLFFVTSLFVGLATSDAASSNGGEK